jgi:hypothetical protein
MNCPCPIDHKIVEAVTAWAQTSDPVERQTALSNVVDLLNQKAWNEQAASIPRYGIEADARRQTPDAGCQTREDRNRMSDKSAALLREGFFMQSFKTERGFVWVSHPNYSDTGESRLIGESSAVGDYADSSDKPGSSFLWVGTHHHLNRAEVEELISRLKHWLREGSLRVD